MKELEYWMSDDNYFRIYVSNTQDYLELQEYLKNNMTAKHPVEYLDHGKVIGYQYTISKKAFKNIELILQKYNLSLYRFSKKVG